jgi:tetratricopeptide (TPR) repeat protein
MSRLRPTAVPDRAVDAEAASRHPAMLELRGDVEPALQAYREAIARWPTVPALHARLGNLLLRLGRGRDALPVLRQAAALEPESAVAQCQLGLALLEIDAPDEAAAALQQAVALRPDFPEASTSLSEALRRQARLAEARQAAEAALAIDFSRPEAHLQLGNVLCDLGEFEAACNAYRRALGLDPNNAGVLSNLGIALYSLGRLPEALAQHRAALALQPESAGFRYNFAVALLAAGEFERGWVEYETRLHLGREASVSLDGTVPRWRGEPLNGQTIVLYGEQGYGDTLQFVRYAPLVAARGGRVILGVPAPLVRLLQRIPGVDRVVAAGEVMRGFDLQCPLLSLPLVFGTRLADIPASIPYLEADPALVANWRARLPNEARRRVGLVWAGNPRPNQPAGAVVDHRRSIPLARFRPLGEVAGIDFVSLQKGPPASELAAAPSGLPMLDPMAAVQDFADTAALLAHIELVITVDTSVAHLAGALGKPVWMLSRFDACWRWLRDRDDSPWYPTMRLYRQAQPGDWDPVITLVASDLKAWSQTARVSS